jgi:hypothetical protein
MNYRTVLTLLVALFLCSASAFSETNASPSRNEIGLGLVLGEPSGINGQFYWDQRSSIGVTVAWSTRDWFFAAADYQRDEKLADSPPEWRWFWGAGAYIGAPAKERGLLGARIPLGLKYHIPQSPVDVWGEIVPALRIIPDTKPEIQGGIGVTFWIK